MEKLKLSSLLIEITSDIRIFEMIHKNSYDIITISDFLKLPKEVVENNYPLLSDLIESNSFKMDYELTPMELRQRNKARTDIEKSMREKRKNIDLDEILEREISKITEIRMPSKSKKILSENGIIKISDILILDYYTLCGSEKGCLKLPFPFIKCLSNYLYKNGLEIAMINPFTLEVKHREDFKQKQDDQIIVHTSQEMTSIHESKENKKETIEQRREQQEKWKKAWYRKYGILKLFHHYHHHILIPKGYKCDGIDLGDWIGTQKKKYFAGSLGQEEIDALENLNIIWRSQRTKEGSKKRKLILKENNIKYIKLSGDEVITTYLDGTQTSTHSSNYCEDLARLLDCENVDEIISQRKESTKSEEDRQNLGEVTGYIQRFKGMSKEEEELREKIEILRKQLNKVKEEMHREYEIKYMKMISLYQIGVEVDIALGREDDEADASEKLSEFDIPTIEESKKLNTYELREKLLTMDMIIEGINEFIKSSLIELKEKEIEREKELNELRQLKQSLEEELGTFQSPTPEIKR